MDPGSISTYTMVWSMLNYPACAFPVTTVDPALDRVQARHTFLSEGDKKNYDLCTPVTSGT